MPKTKIKVRINFRQQAMKNAMKDANFRSLWQAGGWIRRVAKNSIKTRKKDKMKRRTASSKQATAFKKLLAKSDPRVIQALMASSLAARERRETSIPGAVPLTSPQRQLSKAIEFQVSDQRDNVAVGATREAMDLIAKRHEQGGVFEGKRYPKRQFMKPALDKARPRIPQFWARSFK